MAGAGGLFILGFVSAANMSLSAAFVAGCVAYGAGVKDILARFGSVVIDGA